MTDPIPAPASPQDQHVTITRIFNAPRQMVFDAWTDPAQVARWWGPDGFHTPPESVEIDLRVGGHYHLDMVHDTTGRRSPLRYEIIELVAPELIVLRSEPMPEMGMHEPTFTRVELREAGATTKMSLTDGPFPASGYAAQGWNAAFDKLEQLLRPA